MIFHYNKDVSIGINKKEIPSCVIALFDDNQHILVFVDIFAIEKRQ